jgi:hypothetical protein
MPFRYNAFRDQIVQPMTPWEEIDLACLNLGVAAANPSIARIDKEFDPDYKIGGEIVLFGQNVEAEEGDDDPIEITFQFDNFGSIASARSWLEGLGFSTIEEID